MVLAYNPDSTAVVFEMTALFTGGDAADYSHGG